MSKGYFNVEKKQEFRIDANNPYLYTDGNALYSIDPEGKTLLVLYGALFRAYIYGNGKTGMESIFFILQNMYSGSMKQETQN